MRHIQIGAALDKLRRRASDGTGAAEADASLTGATFLEQEPDLAEGSRRQQPPRVRPVAAGGHAVLRVTKAAASLRRSITS